MTPSDEYDDLLPVSTMGDQLLDRHNDGVATWYDSTEIPDRQRLMYAMNHFSALKADRDRLAERVKELEGWIDNGESPILHETRERLATAEAEVHRLKNVIYPNFELEGDEPRPPLSTEELWYVIREKQSALIGHGETIAALTQRLAGMEEALKGLLACVVTTYETQPSLKPEYEGRERKWCGERSCWLYPGDAVLEVDKDTLAKARQALEGKEASHG